MIIMATDYIGFNIIKYLVSVKENIKVVILDKSDPGKYNADIIKLLNDTVEVFYDSEIENEKVYEHIKNKKLKFGILAWWQKILDKRMLALIDGKFINTHPAYLPFNRGRQPYFWNLIDNTVFGATIHYVDESIDGGDILVREKIDTTWFDTGESLYNKSRELVLRLFIDNYDKIKNNKIEPIMNKKEMGTFHTRKELEPISNIDLDKKYYARDLLNIIRGRMFNNKGEAFFIDGDEKFYVKVFFEKEN